MRIAVIYNRESKAVINLFGVPNRERYGRQAIDAIVKALKSGGHNAIAVEGDKDLIDHLGSFMPRVLSGERPGLAFNLSYGIQGQARYTHVPGILEMVGIPYVGSGPLAHSLCLDKVVAKMIMRQSGLPTPDFAVFDSIDFEMPELAFPLIVKPKNEAVSFGLKIVNDESELRDAVGVILEEFSQPVLAEQYIEGREINVGLLGNGPPEALPPAEIRFGAGGPNIYTYEDKTHRSEREIEVICPAEISEALTREAQDIALRAFGVLGCYDCARVDMRIDDQGNLYVLELNSLPSLGAGGSYVKAAASIGLDFPALINRLVDIASARYFGTPSPPQIGTRTRDVPGSVFTFLTQRRDRMEARVSELVSVHSPSNDPVGIQLAFKALDETLTGLNLRPVESLSDEPYVHTWESAAGLRDGTLLIGHIDTPPKPAAAVEPYHRDPEFLYGEGIGSSRAPLVMLEYTLRALRSVRRLRRLPLGITYYGDEGQDAQFSRDVIRAACDRAARVLVLRPGNEGDFVVTERRGQRKYRLTVEGPSQRLGSTSRRPDPLQWLFGKLQEIAKLSSRTERVAVAAAEVHTESFPLRLPHRANVTLLTSFREVSRGDRLETD
ncbi:MAG: ATP-grasp domain-containing protein, partial [Gammaproteobacteria bacterium]